MISGRSAALVALAVALCTAVCGAACWAWGQTPPPHDGWTDKDATGRPAPITFRELHSFGLTYDQVVEKLVAAGCKREELEKYIRFDCEADPNQWFLTKPGTPEHAGVSVAAKGGGHAFPLQTEIVLRPEPPPPEKQEAF